MSYRLDCESIDSTYASLCAAFGCSTEKLQAFLGNPEHLELFESNWDVLPEFREFLYDRASTSFGPPEMPSSICWFHGSRVAPGTTFEEGIQPLGARFVRLEQSVMLELDDPVAQRQVKLAFQRRGLPGLALSVKLRNSIHWGPFGILVREVASHANNLSQHDYLDMPEFIEDLCGDVKASSGINLLPIFQSKWRPVLVKFLGPPADSGRGELQTALCYARSKLLEGRPCSNSVICFDGRNTAVPKEHILGIDWS